MSSNEIRFGRFLLDLVGRQLSCAGRRVKLSSRSLDILCELAGAPGEVVSKDQLMERIWPRRVVEENAIQVHVSALRKALESGSDGQTYVVTVPGRGYRLVGIDSSAAPSAQPISPAIAARGTSVAVLRFANLSGDPGQDYFADGIVEDIITGLSRIGGLSVVGSNSSFLFGADSDDLRTSAASSAAAISSRGACARQTAASGSRLGWWNRRPALHCGLSDTTAVLMIFSRFRTPSR